MRYRERPPSADLAGYVQCTWELEGEASASFEPIFPDGRIEVVVHLADRPRRQGDAHAQPRAMIVGQMLEATRLAPVTRMHAVGVRFTPCGARSWLALPLHAVTGRIEDAGAVCGSAASRLQAAVEGGDTFEERVAAAESAIRLTLRTASEAVNPIAHAVHLIEGRAGVLTIDALARACGLGVRQLERRFLDDVGVSPKAFARITRFQRALRGLRAGVPGAAVAAACGFADQPHLAREFRRFAGLAARHVDLAHVAFLQDTSERPTAHS